mgnify:CR=1 FL=1
MIDFKEIAYSKYAILPLQDKINVIAQTFGYKTGKVVTKLCRGRCRRYTDVFLVFDDKEEFFIGHHLTPEAKTKIKYCKCASFTFCCLTIRYFCRPFIHLLAH